MYLAGRLSAVWHVIILGFLFSGGVSCRGDEQPPPANPSVKEQVEEVLTSTGDFWTEAFRARELTFTRPDVLYLRSESAMEGEGPAHYAVGIGGVLVNELAFLAFREEFPRDWPTAAALVVAHEVGHHVQQQLVEAGREPAITDSRVREQQADCYAGLWFGRKGQELGLPSGAEPDGVPALWAALVRETGPDDGYDHGAPAERAGALARGLAGRDMTACATGGVSAGGTHPRHSPRAEPGVE